MIVSDRMQSRTYGVVFNVTMLVGGLLMLFPFYWLLIASTNTGSAIFSNPPALLPGPHFIDNLAGLFLQTHFADAIINSTIVALIYALVSGVICSMAGYAFAKFRFPGDNAMFWIILFTLAVPSQVTLIPLFKIMVQLKWLNTYQALIVPNLALPFGIFLMRQSMQAVPTELIEAARIDGAGELRIFLRIVLPIVRPSLAALGIFLFLVQWNDFVYPLVVLRTEDAYTIPVALAAMQDVGGTDYGQIMASTFLAVLPVLGIFLVLQRQFVAGMVAGAVKQ